MQKKKKINNVEKYNKQKKIDNTPPHHETVRTVHVFKVYSIISYCESVLFARKRSYTGSFWRVQCHTLILSPTLALCVCRRDGRGVVEDPLTGLHVHHTAWGTCWSSLVYLQVYTWVYKIYGLIRVLFFNRELRRDPYQYLTAMASRGAFFNSSSPITL